MPKLTILAIQAATELRTLAGDKPFSGPTALATYLGRDKSNLIRTLRSLREAGLVVQDKLALTDEGQAMVAALDRAEALESRDGATPMPGGFAELLWIQVEPDPLNPRKHFDEDAIDELADSIARDGLLENLVVRPGVIPDDMRLVRNGVPQAMHRLVAGERRLRAIGRLIERGEWPKDRPIMCKVVDLDDAGHRRVALIENLQRKDLRPIEEAISLKELMALENKGSAEIAKDIGFTQRFVQQRLQLLDLPEKLQDQVNEGELTIEQGRQAAALWPKLPPIKQVELREGKITVERARDWLAAQAPPLDLCHGRELVLLEVGWAIAAKSNGYWTTTPCDYRICSWGKALEAESLLAFDRRPTGAVEVRLTRKSYEHLRRISGADEHLVRASLEPHLRKARVFEAGGSPLAANPNRNAHLDVDGLFKVKRYCTSWLNAPFAPHPDMKAKQAQRDAQSSQWQQERAEREAKWKREREEAEARAKAADAKSIAAVRAFMNPPWAKFALEDAVAVTGHPLPWRFQEGSPTADWALLDANGQEIDLSWGDSARALLRIVMCAMNAAVDLPPALETAEQDNDDQVDLEEAIAAKAEVRL